MKRAAGTLSGSAPTHLGDFLRVTQGAYLVADQFAAQAAVNNRASMLGRAIFRSPPPAMRTTGTDAATATAPQTGASAAEIVTTQDVVASSSVLAPPVVPIPPVAPAPTTATALPPHAVHSPVPPSAPAPSALAESITTTPAPQAAKLSGAGAKVEAQAPPLEEPLTKTAPPPRPTFDRIKYLQEQQQRIKENSKQRKVPSSQVGRLWHFGGLGVRMGMGTLGEAAMRTVGLGSSASAHPAVTPANAQRLTNTLGRMRGAALKLGQMLSIQDSALIPPELAEILDRVRYAADRMPDQQLEDVMNHELGHDWRSRVKEFDPVPIAAASIGQVHRGVLADGREVAIKVQYPGVADSISSDLNNLGSLLKMLGILPKGMYLENTLRVAQDELLWETDYHREAEATMKMKELLSDEEIFVVPTVIPEMSSKKVLTTELLDGQPIEHVVKDDQKTRDMVAESMLRLCLREIFEFRYMQTDPNWSNFLYNPETRKIGLLDFGACRDFNKSFTDEYMRVIYFAAKQDREGIIDASRKLKFLTGEEPPIMNEAHCSAVMILGEPFAKPGPFNFGAQNVTQRIHELIPTMLKYRLTPPPTETYSLHRKLSGAFLLCAKLQAQFACQPMFMDLYRKCGPQ